MLHLNHEDCYLQKHVFYTIKPQNIPSTKMFTCTANKKTDQRLDKGYQNLKNQGFIS